MELTGLAKAEPLARIMPMDEIHIRLAVESDCEQLSRLREALWPESSAAEHGEEITAILSGKYNGTMPMAIFIAEAADAVVAGFLEVGLRSHADGCNPKHRDRGFSGRSPSAGFDPKECPT
jgi:hypothetical protein